MTIVEKTDFLVVIGYSFPDFNREADRVILKDPRILRKVYVQNRPEAMPGIVDRIRNLTAGPRPEAGPEIVPIESTDQFHVTRHLFGDWV